MALVVVVMVMVARVEERGGEEKASEAPTGECEKYPRRMKE